MRRREFLGLVGGGIAWPAVARGQQQTVPTIGFLSSRSLEDSKPHLEGFLRGLGAFGYIDGKTAKIEYRWANGKYDQLRKLACELAALQPAMIAAAGGAPSARAAKSVTTTIPITFVAGDSVTEGIVGSHWKAARFAGTTSPARHSCWISHQQEGCSKQPACKRL